MSKYKLSVYLLIITALILIMSCKKKAGEGGKASIYGKVWVEDWNKGFTLLEGAYAGTDWDVYIIYGEEVNYGDKVSTNYKGEFEFKYLRKGKYKVYVYSKDNTLTSASGDTSVVKEVEIRGRKESVDIGTITVFD